MEQPKDEPDSDSGEKVHFDYKTMQLSDLYIHSAAEFL